MSTLLTQASSGTAPVALSLVERINRALGLEPADEAHEPHDTARSIAPRPCAQLVKQTLHAKRATVIGFATFLTEFVPAGEEAPVWRSVRTAGKNVSALLNGHHQLSPIKRAAIAEACEALPKRRTRRPARTGRATPRASSRPRAGKAVKVRLRQRLTELRQSGAVGVRGAIFDEAQRLTQHNGMRVWVSRHSCECALANFEAGAGISDWAAEALALALPQVEAKAAAGLYGGRTVSPVAAPVAPEASAEQVALSAGESSLAAQVIQILLAAGRDVEETLEIGRELVRAERR